MIFFMLKSVFLNDIFFCVKDKVELRYSVRSSKVVCRNWLCMIFSFIEVEYKELINLVLKVILDGDDLLLIRMIIVVG